MITELGEMSAETDQMFGEVDPFGDANPDTRR